MHVTLPGVQNGDLNAEGLKGISSAGHNGLRVTRLPVSLAALTSDTALSYRCPSLDCHQDVRVLNDRSLAQQGTTAMVRALEDLPAGAPLWHCYGPQTGQHVTLLRQHLLRRQYHFDCRCRGWVLSSCWIRGLPAHEATSVD